MYYLFKGYESWLDLLKYINTALYTLEFLKNMFKFFYTMVKRHKP